ncbi:c-type cytochrome [Paenibacillus lemnae]|uniref:Cytochrome c n=1 Tax=Paenibacillus lemnae TaxID=1330551 RepID=A0A848M408_PAELE|nr:cytochrome c [Paenibacillus lemnae]NMO94404.1 cytochrome c [Paenibacillus lemnae]
MKKKFMKYCSILILCGLSTACGGDKPNENAGIEDSALPATYKQNCLSCHGGQLEGGFGPGLQTIGSKLTQEDIINVITNGQGRMPAFEKRLEENEILSIAEWLSDQQ